MALPTLSIGAPIDANHILIVTATYEIQNTGGGTDWGGSAYVYAYKIQNSIQVNGDHHPYTGTRTPFTIQYSFSLLAGYSITASIGVNTGGAGTTAKAWNIKLQGEVIKR